MPSAAGVASGRAWLYLGVLVAGYIGVYLCRANFAVANPLLQKEFGVTKGQIGYIASLSTFAYMAGKFLFGALIDRFGGRICFLLSLLGVAIFGGLGGMVTGLVALTWVYSANRLTGSAAWGGMVKLVPEWFDAKQLPLAMAFLSLSFVFGGAIALLLAGQIAEWSGDNWRAVMGLPSLVLLVLLGVAWYLLPRGNSTNATAVNTAPTATGSGEAGESVWARISHVLTVRQIWIVLALSFGLTLFRETFNTWIVDFVKTEGGGDVSTKVASWLSTPFSIMGALGIIVLGWAFGRLSRTNRARLLVVILGALAVLMWNLPNFFNQGLWAIGVSLGLIGFLSYGPYSLLAGILAVEVRGPAYVATVAGFVDGVGYLASIMAGKHFGQIVDAGGYRLGFHVLAGIAAACAVMCLFLYSGRQREEAK